MSSTPDASQIAERRAQTGRSYYRAASELRGTLSRSLPQDELKALHRRDPLRHFALVARQFLLLGLCGWVCATQANPLLWVPAAILLGFTLFNFTVLLHEVVHNCVFASRRPRWNRALGLLYAFPSGISASQFTRWHTDHHDNLGTEDLDPKRHYLSPKRVARWYKLLYCTPFLFPLYFQAARRETAHYDEGLQRTITWERRLTIGGHLAILALIVALGGWAVAARMYLVPYFLVFPVAFTLNRLGQHYYIDPSDPAKWSTRVDGNAAWQFLFLYSNFHLEHHYFQSVPAYNLPALNRLLRPFYAERGVQNHGYGEILWKWFVRNERPHTNWDSEEEGPRAEPAPAS